MEHEDVQGAHDDAQGVHGDQPLVNIQGTDQTANACEQREAQDVPQASIQIREEETEDTQTENQPIQETENGEEDFVSEEKGDSDIEARREMEKARRGSHWEIDTEKYGKGKRKPKKRDLFSFAQKKKQEQPKWQPKWRNKKRKKRNRKGMRKSYSFLQKQYTSLDESERLEFFEHALTELRTTKRTELMERFTTGMAFAQLSVNKGVQKYGREAELKLMAEFVQLLEYKVFHGIKAESISREQKKGAADMINIIEEKLNRGHTPENPVLRARSVFNGKVQRGLYSKEEIASPTVAQDSFFMTSIIDAVEGRDVAITDIKGAYLNAVMTDLVIMKIRGKSVDLFCELDPSLKEFVVIEKGNKVLYVQLDKALYGCVKSAVLWFNTYSQTLKDMGFELNPYDNCVANAMIDGKQCTIVWYVDDNKISHVDAKVVDKVIAKIEERYGEMSKTRGKEHEFLGMVLKFSDGKLEISMEKHIEKALDSFMGKVAKRSATPARTYLFEVREKSPVLDEKRADNFHSVVALLLFISRRCRLDIQTAIGFLTTRVSCPNEDDWLKLARVLGYLEATKNLKLVLGADDIKKMKSWVDVSYGVHTDCRSHTGGCASFGWGVLLTMCQKQKLNVKSSTEGETVGASDYLPNMIWARMFLEEQGFSLEENILYQDNQSAMKLELNGRMSCGKKTKHMDNRYFWIKDRVKTEKIKIEYCPTQMMVSDFFTKPLQCKLFKRFREVVLGHVHISSLEKYRDEKTSSQERVKNHEDDEQSNESNGVDVFKSSAKKVTWADIVKRSLMDTDTNDRSKSFG